MTPSPKSQRVAQTRTVEIKIPTHYTAFEERAIVQFANGSKDREGEARAAYVRVLTTHGTQADPYSDFMRHYFTKTTDYLQRGFARREVIQNHIRRSR